MNKHQKIIRALLVMFLCLSIIITSSSTACASNVSSMDEGSFLGEDSLQMLEPTRSAGIKYEVEPNNTIYAADSTEDDYDNYGIISSANDIDWWKVSFNQCGYANFWLGNIPSGCDYDLELYASDGSTLLEYSRKSGNQSELISKYWVTKSTEYYIKIYSYSGYSQSQYKFRTKNYPYHNYAGVDTSSNNKGVSATIRVPYSLPNVYDAGVSAWVSTEMLSYSGTSCWIQAGCKYYSDQSSFKTYVEYFQNGVMKHTVYNNQSLGTTRTYKVEYKADNKWHAFVAGTEKISCTLPEDECHVQAMGEVHKPNIRMGPFYFTDVKVKTTSNSWVDNTKSPYANPPYYVTGNAKSFTVDGP